MKTKKKLEIIPITETNRAKRQVRKGMLAGMPPSKSLLYMINSVPCRVEYTEDGVKVWTIN